MDGVRAVESWTGGGGGVVIDGGGRKSGGVKWNNFRSIMCLQVSRVQCHQAVVLWCLNYSNFVCLSLVML